MRSAGGRRSNALERTVPEANAANSAAGTRDVAGRDAEEPPAHVVEVVEVAAELAGGPEVRGRLPPRP
jgi:hypothetical protein